LNFMHQFLVYADDVYLLVQVYRLYRRTERLQQASVKRLVKQ
jgi:hypothetical protein